MGNLMPCLLLLLLFLASFVDFLALGQEERCGQQGGGYYDTCNDGRCCSRFGYCGTTYDYCGPGCQSFCGERCGRIAGGTLCQGGRCCSQFGYCGSTRSFCGNGCQSQCNGGVVSNTNSSLFDEFLNISSSQFDEFLKHRNDTACPRKNFYTYDAFLAAAHSFSGFATTGDTDSRKREIAAFFAQTSTGGCGDEPTISFKMALSFWMTPQSPKPSCHDVITGKWTPSASDRVSGRVPGFGVITNIINGGVECGKGSNPHVSDHIKFYKRYCDILEVSYGDNLDCYNQSPWVG